MSDSRPLHVKAMLALKGEKYRIWSNIYWHQGDNDDAWPSQECIAGELDLCVRYVKQITKELAEEGWLTVTWPNGPGRGKEHTKRYVCTCPEKVNPSSPIEAEKRGTTEHLLPEEKGNAGSPFEQEKGNCGSQKRGTVVPLNTTQGTLPRKNNTPPNPPKGECGALFDKFWDAYPRKIGKDAARRAFAKRKPDESLLAVMLDAIDTQRECEQWTREDGRFIPHPATWLNQGRWQDEVRPDGDSIRITNGPTQQAALDLLEERYGPADWAPGCSPEEQASQTPEERAAIASLLAEESPKAAGLDREECQAFRTKLAEKVNELLRNTRNEQQDSTKGRTIPRHNGHSGAGHPASGLVIANKPAVREVREPAAVG